MTRSRKKVFVTRKLPEAVEARLSKDYDATLNIADEPVLHQNLANVLRNYDALVPTVSDNLDAELLRSPENRVRVIANVGVGVNNIDVSAAGAANIVVTNTPDVLTEATADVALMLILASTRRAFAAESRLRNDLWYGFSLVEGLGTSVQGKVLGIVGMGRIGQATARRAVSGLGMRVIFYNRSPVTDLPFEAEQIEELAELMQRADVVSIHIPGGNDTAVIDRAHLALMKRTAYLINTARGDCVDQAALVDALVTGRIAGAGLDVFTHEPSVPEALRNLDNVTLLPHIGSATIEVRTAMGMLAVDNLDAFFQGSAPPNRVN